MHGFIWGFLALVVVISVWEGCYLKSLPAFQGLTRLKLEPWNCVLFPHMNGRGPNILNCYVHPSQDALQGS